MKKNKIRTFLTPYTKINSKWIKDLNTRQETKKFLEEDMGRTLLEIRTVFFGSVPYGKGNKSKHKQTELIKLKSKVNHRQNPKTIYCMGENIYKDMSDKGLISKIY